MAFVEWEWKLLLSTTAGGGTSHRIARRIANGQPAISSPTEPNNHGIDAAYGSPPSWKPSVQPPATLDDGNGNKFVFAFWHVQAGTTNGMYMGAHVVPYPSLSVTVGEMGAKATAYYVWNFGTGPGSHAILIDAFDRDAGFIPDDFVEISPGDGLPKTDTSGLYYKANDGFLNTHADFNVDQTITAFNPNMRQFVQWHEIKSLTAPAVNGPKVMGNDLLVQPGCILVAFAEYFTIAQPPIRVPEIIRTAGWWISHGPMVDGPGWGIPPGGGPPIPIPPWGGPLMQRAMIGLSLANAAKAMTPELRNRALDLAADQLKATAEEIKRERSPGGGNR